MSDKERNYVAPPAINDQERARLGDAARTLAAHRSGVVLTGRVVNGRVELDKDTLADISKRFPNAEISFVAVNAPFDPQSVAA